MVGLPQNEKQIHRLDARPQIWPSVMTLTITLTLDFQGQMLNLLCISEKMGQLPGKEKQNYPRNTRPEM